MTPPLRQILLASVLLLPLAHGGTARATDLGPGNAAVKQAFAAYQAGGHRVPAKPASKSDSAAPKRVLITGFGLFSGVKFNISGVVVESLANPKFWPATTKLAALPTVPEQALVGTGRLTKKDGGARAWSRSLTIDGVRYEVCFLIVDVLWDLGGAITLWEADHFQPDLIVMTGRGGATAVFESGSLNRAIPYSGFLADGRPDPANKPILGTVLEAGQPGVEPAIGMAWDNQALAAAVRPIIDGMGKGHTVVAAPAARPRNTYICNNISCVVLHGLKGQTLALAGGAIKLKTDHLKHATAGFLHLPAAATNEAAEVRAWALVLATLVKTHFAATRLKPGSAASR